MSSELGSEDQSSDWSRGDSRVGHGVPKAVRRGGATGPTLKQDLSGNGTAYIGHSVTFECEECRATRRFATSSFIVNDHCDECGELRFFEFKWGLNR